MILIRRALLPSLIVFAVACGGGSDGLTEVTITEQNAQTLAGQGVGAVEVLSQTTELVEMFSGIMGSQTAAIENCPSDGHIDFSINDVAPENELSTGDSARITFRGCEFETEDGVITLNGTIRFSADQVTDSGEGAFSHVLSCEFDGMSVVGLPLVMTVDGAYTLSLSSTDGVQMTSVVRGDRFSAYLQFGPLSVSRTLTNFEEVKTYNEETGAYGYSLDCDCTGSLIGGTVKFQTEDDFVGVEPNDPDTGTLVVTGKDGGTVTMLVLDNVNVRLLVDVDGDEEVDFTIDTTWDFLQEQD